MNTILKLLGVTCGLVVLSCKGDIELTPGLEEFDVNTDKTVYEVNEEVMFNFKGEPDIIYFYSGELYNDYAYRDERIIDLQKTLLSFTSAHPVLEGGQAPDYRVLVSTDFNDVYTYENLVNANWTDITSEFSYGLNTVNQVASGNYEVSQLYEAGKPLYVAFRYTNKSQEDHGPVRRFLFQNFKMAATSIFGEHILADPVTVDFRLIEKNEEYKTSSSLTNTTLTFNGYTRAMGSSDPDPETDTWAVSKVFDLDRLDNGPDKSVALKGNQDPVLLNHFHSYQQPGEYTVTFVALNANISGSKEVVKHIKITVVEPE